MSKKIRSDENLLQSSLNCLLPVQVHFDYCANVIVLRYFNKFMSARGDMRNFKFKSLQWKSH